MRPDKEHRSNGAPSAAEAPWLRDPPKERTTTEGSPDLEAELDKLAQGIAEEVESDEKAPAKIIMAGGLDEAKAYIAPTRPAIHPQHATIEMQRVRIAAKADPRNAETEKVDPAVALRAAGLGDAAASPESTEDEAWINRALLPSSYAPHTTATGADAVSSPTSAPSLSRKLGIAVLLAVSVVAILAGSVRLLRSKESARDSLEPAASLATESPSSVSTGVRPIAVAPAAATELPSAPSDPAAPAIPAAGSSVSPATAAPPGMENTVLLTPPPAPAAAIAAGPSPTGAGVPRPAVVVRPSGRGSARAPSKGLKPPVKPGVKSSAHPELFE